jgi:hypothetical protein
MQISLQGSHGGGRMIVIGSRHDHSVQVFLFQQLAIVMVRFRAGVQLRGSGQSLFIHIAQGHDRFGTDGSEIGTPTATDPDRSNVQSIIGAQYT